MRARNLRREELGTLIEDEDAPARDDDSMEARVAGYFASLPLSYDVAAMRPSVFLDEPIFEFEEARRMQSAWREGREDADAENRP